MSAPSPDSLETVRLRNMSPENFAKWMFDGCSTEALMSMHSRIGDELQRRYHEAKRKQAEEAAPQPHPSHGEQK